MTRLFPAVRMRDCEAFRERLVAALDEATMNRDAAGIITAATAAARYIEDTAEQAGLAMDPINNSTMTLCLIAQSFAAHLATAEAADQHRRSVARSRAR